MPAKLESCVKKVMAQGHSKSSAYAICTAALEGKDLDMTTPRKVKREKARGQAAARRAADMRQKAALQLQAADDLEAQSDVEPVGPEPEVKSAAEEKCCGDMPMEAYRPHGGATSIADALSADEARKKAWAIQDATYLLQDVVSNILSDDEIADKAAAITKAAGEFQALLADPTPLMKALDDDPPADLAPAVPISTDIPETKESLWRKFTGWLMGRKDQPAHESSSGFKVVSGQDGEPYWFGWVSNKYRDISTRPHPQGEIFTEAAHKEFVAHLDAHPEAAPELWTWHVPGTARKARADWWEYADGFLMMSGPLTEDEAKAFDPDEALGMSHGFYVLDRDAANGYINQYRTYEVTELLPDAAANPFTNFDVWRKELATMAFSEKQRSLLVKRFGEAKVAELEKDTSAMNKALEQIGWESKDKGQAAPAAEAKDAAMDACMEKHKKMGHDEATAHKMCLEEAGKESGKALADQVTALAAAVAEIKQLVTAQAETKAVADKAQADRLTAIETGVKVAQEGVAELKGELPRAYARAGGYRASEQGDPPPAELKDFTAQPHPDPMEKHWKAITSAAGNPAAGGQ